MKDEVADGWGLGCWSKRRIYESTHGKGWDIVLNEGSVNQQMGGVPRTVDEGIGEAAVGQEDGA